MFKENSIALAIIQYTPFAMAFFIAFSLPTAINNPSAFGKICISLFGVGFLCFLGAKIFNFKKGLFFSFGTKGMSKYQRWSYLAGYFLMVTGFIATMILGVALRVEI